jgi:hypothetical protein
MTLEVVNHHLNIHNQLARHCSVAFLEPSIVTSVPAATFTGSATVKPVPCYWWMPVMSINKISALHIFSAMLF